RFTLRKGTINLADMQNIGGFEAGLRYDVNRLREICDSLEAFAKDYRNGFEQDKKLEELVTILQGKQKAENKKVVIFTAYADTAKFLFDELTRRGFSHIASVSGQDIHTTGRQQTSNFNEVLQCFAPYSKLYKERDWNDLYEDAHLSRPAYYDDERRRWDVPYDLWLQLIETHRLHYAALLHDPIDILIATDCLSEGQNLQDADMQVNYDIHWNPVRLIQRFGRIDRIGSPCHLIRCVNFWPAKSFEDYLHLETRIMNRMVAMNLVGSETQQLNDAYIKMEADNPLQDKNADRLLEELQNNSISDIESPRTLSLKDFSFEVYRQDLIDYFEKNKEVFRRMPNGIFSGFKHTDTLFEQIPESLVAVIGYPHREQGSNKPYREIYLMCQPVDNQRPATYTELNRAEVLGFLRQNKTEERFVPEWIETHQSDRISRLSNIIEQWMETKVPQQATAAILQIAQSRNGVLKQAAQDKNAQLLEEKFKKENFDLIVWEYVSK
ncbi:MAG: SWF/SNF helicase family protein, partial [Bacteroidales bacterium]|nr:SWF/SNF helicase family protein [Bacteroidales bacterium]